MMPFTPGVISLRSWTRRAGTSFSCVSPLASHDPMCGSRVAKVATFSANDDSGSKEMAPRAEGRDMTRSRHPPRIGPTVSASSSRNHAAPESHRLRDHEKIDAIIADALGRARDPRRVRKASREVRVAGQPDVVLDQVLITG